MSPVDLPSPYGNDPPAGFAWRWVPSQEVGDGWEVVQPGDAKQCRSTPGGVRCTAWSVARLNRRWWRTDSSPQWWHYCGDHMYGRVADGGAVWTCILLPLNPEDDFGGGDPS